jgi:phosphoadenosine phosphosulfate reductase
MSEPKPLFAPLKPTLTTAKLWSQDGFVHDTWRTIADDAPLPIDGRGIVSLARWRADQTEIASNGVDIGVSAQVADVIDPIADDIARLAVIALPFPKFSDGRSYSTARRLRETGYKGQIRATGDVLLDQLPLMLRAGFDAFEITHAATIAALNSQRLPAVLRVYQSGAPQTVQDLSAQDWRSRRAVAAR